MRNTVKPRINAEAGYNCYPPHQRSVLHVHDTFVYKLKNLSLHQDSLRSKKQQETQVICDIALNVYLHSIASPRKCWRIKWSLHTAFSTIFSNLIFRCSFVSLLSAMMRCTQDGSSDDAISHYKHRSDRYVSLRDIAIKLLSTRIASRWAIIWIAISLQVRCEWWYKASPVDSC